MDTYICPACQFAVPTQAFAKDEMARFCVNCGLPVSMLCPYEKTSDADSTRLMLRNAQGMAPSACTSPDCGGLLKFCPRCGRLHRLQDPACLTTKCAESPKPPTLQEASLPYATAQGAQEGTHAAACRGHFTPQTPREIATLQVGDVDQLAYRYGLLVTVSGRSLTTYLWNGQQWQKRRPPLPLSSTQDARALALILDDGFAFVLTTEGWYVVALDTVAIRKQNADSCLLQAKRGNWWARVRKGEFAEQSVVVIMNCALGTERAVVLPVSLQDVTDMVIGDVIYVASAKGDIFLINPATGEFDTRELFATWKRLALVDQRLIALGSNENGQTVLAALTANGQQEGPFHQSERMLTDMAVVNDEIYIAGDTQIAKYRALLLSQRPTTKTLMEGEQTQPGFIALRDQAGSTRLVLYRSDARRGHLYLYDPTHGDTKPIGSLLISPPQFCMADERLVIALREINNTKLNTYVLGEDAK